MSVFSIGALVGALVSGLLSDLAGRKVAIVIGGCLYALGGTLQASSFYIWSDDNYYDNQYKFNQF